MLLPFIFSGGAGHAIFFFFHITTATVLQARLFPQRQPGNGGTEAQTLGEALYITSLPQKSHRYTLVANDSQECKTQIYVSFDHTFAYCIPDAGPATRV